MGQQVRIPPSQRAARTNAAPQRAARTNAAVAGSRTTGKGGAVSKQSVSLEQSTSPVDAALLGKIITSLTSASPLSSSQALTSPQACDSGGSGHVVQHRVDGFMSPSQGVGTLMGVRLLSRVILALLILRVCFLVLALLGLIFIMVQIHMVMGNLLNLVIRMVMDNLLNLVICLKISTGLHLLKVHGLRIIMVKGLRLSMVICLQVIMVLGIIVNKVLGLFLILGISSRLRLLTMVILKSLAFDVPGA